MGSQMQGITYHGVLLKICNTIVGKMTYTKFVHN